MYEDELMRAIDAEYETRPLRGNFDWREWRLLYLGDDCADISDEEYSEDSYDEEDEEDYDEDEEDEEGYEDDEYDDDDDGIMH